MQEKFLFQYYYTDSEKKFDFKEPFQEIFLETGNDVSIHGLLFKQENPAGLVIVSRENNGELEDFMPSNSPLYTKLNHDLFVYDYRGNGKSRGESENQESLFNDLRFIYDHFKNRYGEKRIILMGNSFGTGIATKIASETNPGLLVLKNPYYKYNELLRQRYGWMPLKLINNYQLETFQYMDSCSCPVLIFHGEKDKTIKSRAGKKLSQHGQGKSKMVIIENSNHQDISKYDEYFHHLKNMLGIE